MSSMPCAVTADLSRYLEKIDEEELRESAIESRVDELMAGDMAPFSEANLSEALAEIDIRHIATLLSAGKQSDAGAELARRVCGYWETLATRRATTEIDNRKRCPLCRGAGCRRCDESLWEDDCYAQ